MSGTSWPGENRGRRARKRAPLDTNAKFVGKAVADGVSERVDLDTGELLRPYDPLLKWELQNVAARFMPKGHRLQLCHRVRRADSSIEVRVSEQHKKAFYSGLQTCGLVWLCPVCAPKIQSVRALEAEQGILSAEESGLVVELVTLTVPHHRGQTLRELVQARDAAWRTLQQARGFRRWADDTEIVGWIVGSETTWGTGHGWHPHIHGLRFRAGAVSSNDPGQLETHDLELFRLWKEAVARRGLGEASINAFDVRDGSHAHEYVAKLGKEYTWGLQDEMARSHTKRGRRESLTPFDFLRRGAEGADGPWESLWREYAAAYKGKQQLRWSKGLRQRLGVMQRGTDEQIAASIGETWSWARNITADEWKLIRKFNGRGVLLQVALDAGQEGVRLYLDSLRGRELVE